MTWQTGSKDIKGNFNKFQEKVHPTNRNWSTMKNFKQISKMKSRA